MLLTKLSKTIWTMLLAGLGALPLLFLVGCADSGFTASDANASPSSLGPDASANVPPITDNSVAEESPIVDCAKPNSRKVLVCHVPPGNPNAKRTICTDESGATHGHGLNLADPYAIGGHGGDHLGDCAAIEAEETGAVPGDTAS